MSLPSGPQMRGRQRADRLRRQRDAAGRAELRFALQIDVGLRLAGQHADRAHEGGDRDAHARDLVGGGGDPVELPVDDVGIGEAVAEEAEARHDHGISVLVRLDVEQRDRQHVAAHRAFDEDRAGHRMHEVEVERGHVLGGRLQIEVAVEGVARLEDDDLPGLDMRHRRDCRMIAVEAVRIVAAMAAALADDDRRLVCDFGGVGLRWSGNGK